MKESLKDHVLTLVQEGEVTAYYLGKKGTRMMSCLLLFTPEGIAIMGDLTPQLHGSVSVYGYGIGWFSKHLSEGYLCEKFLRERFVPELAEKELRDPEGYWREELSPEVSDRIADDLCDHGQEWLYEELLDAGVDCSDGIPGFGYDPAEAGWLCAIQQRFSELYSA
jgi:hypothetical protein